MASHRALRSQERSVRPPPFPSPAPVNSWEFPVVLSLLRALFFPHVLSEWNGSGRPQTSRHSFLCRPGKWGRGPGDGEPGSSEELSGRVGGGRERERVVRGHWAPTHELPVYLLRVLGRKAGCTRYLGTATWQACIGSTLLSVYMGMRACTHAGTPFDSGRPFCPE